jgi:nitrite reductase/ring-hydroxylating ferredoxin subunit
MELVRTYSVSTIHVPNSISKTQFTKPNFLNFQFNPIPSSCLLRIHGKTSSKSKLFTISPSPSSVSTDSIGPPEPEVEVETKGEKFDWYAQWYPLMPVCDLDKRVPHAKKVLGLDVVVWWDRNESEWKVFDDTCPHRLAPLSEGRIDQWGRLQCVYHGWCFNGSGDCKLIPQAPPDGPPVIIIFIYCLNAYYLFLDVAALYYTMLTLKHYYMVLHLHRWQ